MLRLVLAFLAAVFATAANAQTIIQYSHNGASPAQGALLGFDYSLGTLDSVTLLIQATENRSLAGHVGLWPTSAPAAVDVTWTIDGTSGFNAYG
jgi:hypothetical protein